MSLGVLFRRLSIVASLVMWVTVVPVVDLPDKLGVVHEAVDLGSDGVIKAPITFGLLGVTWPATEAEPAEIEVRTSTDGKRWSSWEELDADEVDLGPDEGAEGSGLRATTPLWVGKARFADVRVEGTLPKGARVHVIDPGPDPSAPRASVLASPAEPAIITRAAWGADESIRKCCPNYAPALKGVVIHHTATGNSYSPQQSAAIVRSIYTYHVKGNGWNDIGYNFLVDRHGQVFEGRAGGITSPVIGAHAQGFNTGSAGMAVIGTFSSSRPPAAAWNALVHLASWRLDVNHIDPLSTTTMTSLGSSKYPAGREVTLPRVWAHRDVGTTSCPGQAFYNALGGLRTEVASHGDPKLYSPVRTGSIITPNGDGVADALRMTARFSSPVSWTVDVVDPGGKVWKTVSGSGTALDLSWDGKGNDGKAVPHDRYALRIHGSNERGSLRVVQFSANVWRYPNGTLFRTTSGWYGVLEGQKLRHFLTEQAVTTRYGLAEAISVPDELLRVYPMGNDIGFRDGSVVSADGKLWIISDGRRRPVSQPTLDALGYDRRATINTQTRFLSPHPEGGPVTFPGAYPNGTALKGIDFGEGMVRSSTPRPFSSKEMRLSHGIRDVDLAGPALLEMLAAQAQPPVGFRDGSLIRSSSDPRVYVIADGMRRLVTSSHRFEVMGYRWGNVRDVGAAEFALHGEGPPI